MSDELRRHAFNSSLITHHFPFPPEEVDGDACRDDCEADGAVGRVLVDRCDDDERAGRGEERGGEGVAGDSEARARFSVGGGGRRRFINLSLPSAEDEERDGGDSEPDEVYRDDVVEYLLILPRGSDD